MIEKKVLIVDDDARNIFALSALLRAKGVSTVSVPGAKEGLDEIATNKNIGVVLLDMMMPDMDGYEFLHILRGNSETVSFPVIAVTAQAMVGDREKCIAAGADEYISKPIDVDALMEYLQHYLK